MTESLYNWKAVCYKGFRFNLLILTKAKLQCNQNLLM